MIARQKEKRISDLEKAAHHKPWKVKELVVDRDNYKEKLEESKRLQDEGYLVILRTIVAPGDPKENSEWGEYLRRKKSP